MVPDRQLAGTIRKRLEIDGDRVSDLHLWRLGPGHVGLIVSVVSDRPQAPAAYKQPARRHCRPVACHRRGARLRRPRTQGGVSASIARANGPLLYAAAFAEAPMSVDAKTVRRIAHLARIAVADDEVEHLQGELNAMLAFVEQLVGGRCRGRRADDLGDADGDEEAARTWSPTATMPRRCCRTRRRARITSSWCRKWWNNVHGLRNGDVLAVNGRHLTGQLPPATAPRMPMGLPRRRLSRAPDGTMPATRRKPQPIRLEPQSFRLRRAHEPMTELTSLTLAEARDRLRKKDFSAAELADAHLARDREGARAQRLCAGDAGARARDGEGRRRAHRQGRGAVRSKAFRSAIKDLFCTEGVRTTACSHILDNFVPTYESTVTASLWRDGAVMLGKTNNDEFAMGSSNETSHFGPVQSPWRREGSNTPLVPGGSSGGSAAAVAAQLCLGATGTDTGGSIRQPAAFTGTVGIKPTYGRCSRWGIVAFASSLDQAGPFARTVRDAAILLRSMAGHDPKDTTCVDLPVPDYEAAVGQSVKGLRIGIPKEYRLDGMPAEIEKLWEQGARLAARPPAPSWSTCRCRTPNTRCRPITSSRRRRPRPISRAMTACATACACPAATSPTCTRRRAPQASARRCAGAS